MTASVFSKVEDIVGALSSDSEFRMAARHWIGGVRFVIANETLEVAVRNGLPSAEAAPGTGVIELRMPREVWEGLTQKIPPRGLNDLGPGLLAGIRVIAEPVLFAQYYPAVQRMIEVLRPANDEQHAPRDEARPAGTHDSPVGRYVHLTLQGQDHRIYYEQAGTGIPLLLQHTAGAHGVQWRHLFEVPAITDHFRLIAYDLPFHGKSIPPVGRAWWQEEYKLTAEFVRSVPIALVKALGLKNAAFMGCSVGGVLALDLAAHHPDVFDHVIAVEGALNIPGDTNDFVHQAFWHPQVSNEFKGRLMHGLTAPHAPEAYRRETIQTYMAGWPPLFLGDLHYYVNELDVREEASEIDTSRVGVHIMNGEYDPSGTIESGEIAHSAIKGSTHTIMPSVGHFPMSEHPEAFLKHLLPILDSIRTDERRH